MKRDLPELPELQCALQPWQLRGEPSPGSQRHDRCTDLLTCADPVTRAESVTSAEPVTRAESATHAEPVTCAESVTRAEPATHAEPSCDRFASDET